MADSKCKPHNNFPRRVYAMEATMKRYVSGIVLCVAAAFSGVAQAQTHTHIMLTPASKPQGSGKAGTNLVYHPGGPVMRNPQNYLIFWQPPGRAAFPAGYVTGIQNLDRKSVV